jgi:hypothetical protein
MPSATNPATYCRTLRQLVQGGVYDFYTANAMWQNYRTSLKTLGLPDPGPCALGPEGPTQPVFDPGDGGYYAGEKSLVAPDAAYGVQEVIERVDPASSVDPMNWFPIGKPEIPLDPLAAGGGFGGLAPYDPYFPSSGGHAPFEGGVPDIYAPGPGSARTTMPVAVPDYARPRVEVMARGPDGTYYPVPYVPMHPPPPAPPPDAPPSPYEGVPVTGSFAIKD